MTSLISSLQQKTCRTNIFFFWLTTKFIITSRSLLIKSPNTVFGILPVGHREENISYRNISSIQQSSRVHIIRLLLGIYLFTSSFRLVHSPQFFKFGMIELILGAVLLLFSYKATLKIINNSGHTIIVEVPFSESSKIKAISREINNQVSN